MESQSIDLMFALRGALKKKLISSHILSSVEKLQGYVFFLIRPQRQVQVEYYSFILCRSTPLRRLLFGYALSGEKVSRETRLTVIIL